MRDSWPRLASTDPTVDVHRIVHNKLAIASYRSGRLVTVDLSVMVYVEPKFTWRGLLRGT